MPEPLVGIIMGSKSDWETMRHAADVLTQFGIDHESKVVSAHRTPSLMAEYASAAAGRGLAVIIAGAANAGLLAVAILATSRPELRAKLQAYRDEMAADVGRASLT